MTIRSNGLRWLARHHRVRDADIFVSRFYPADQSWTSRAAWWFQLPVHRIDALGDGSIHLVGESAAGASSFHYLRVPASFLREHLHDLDRPDDGRMVSLFLSAEPETRFQDAQGKVDFTEFVRS